MCVRAGMRACVRAAHEGTEQNSVPTRQDTDVTYHKMLHVKDIFVKVI